MYEIVLHKKSIKRPYYLLTIKADWNDADYLVETYEFTEKEMQSNGCAIYKWLYAHMGASFHKCYENYYLCNARTGQIILEDDLPREEYDNDDWFEMNEFLPYESCSGCRCHTLDKLTLEYYSPDGSVYDVEIIERKEG
jgi:hypothetical protein